MAKAYSTVSSKNTRADMTKIGGKNGIRASVQSWNGSVITDLSFDENDIPIIKIGIANGSSATYENL